MKEIAKLHHVCKQSSGVGVASFFSPGAQKGRQDIFQWSKTLQKSSVLTTLYRKMAILILISLKVGGKLGARYFTVGQLPPRGYATQAIRENNINYILLLLKMWFLLAYVPCNLGNFEVVSFSYFQLRGLFIFNDLF